MQQESFARLREDIQHTRGGILHTHTLSVIPSNISECVAGWRVASCTITTRGRARGERNGLSFAAACTLSLAGAAPQGAGGGGGGNSASLTSAARDEEHYN